jgi:hypothetical protein
MARAIESNGPSAIDLDYMELDGHMLVILLLNYASICTH